MDIRYTRQTMQCLDMLKEETDFQNWGNFKPNMYVMQKKVLAKCARKLGMCPHVTLRNASFYENGGVESFRVKVVLFRCSAQCSLDPQLGQLNAIK